jgi:hypothetical protein
MDMTIMINFKTDSLISKTRWAPKKEPNITGIVKIEFIPAG